jgi:hypothetical protein
MCGKMPVKLSGNRGSGKILRRKILKTEREGRKREDLCHGPFTLLICQCGYPVGQRVRRRCGGCNGELGTDLALGSKTCAFKSDKAKRTTGPRSATNTSEAIPHFASRVEMKEIVDGKDLHLLGSVPYMHTILQVRRTETLDTNRSRDRTGLEPLQLISTCVVHATHRRCQGLMVCRAEKIYIMWELQYQDFFNCSVTPTVSCCVTSSCELLNPELISLHVTLGISRLKSRL